MEYLVPEYGVGSLYGIEEVEAIAAALQHDTYEGAWLLGQFEKEFAAYTGARFAIGTVSGTMALHLVAHLLGLGPEDEVICTPQTFQATMLPFLARDTTVRFADIEPDTLCIDPATIQSLITPRTKAIYVMHYGGLPCDMDPIMAVAKQAGLPVVEDAAHAAGANYRDRKIGAIADLTCFSFGSLKNMTTLGRGGMITTNNATFAERLYTIRYRGFGGRRRQRRTTNIGPYHMPEPMYSDHAGDSWTHDWTEITDVALHVPMSGAEAAVGRVQLRKLDHMNQVRRDLARRYANGLTRIEGVRVQPDLPGRPSVYHLFPFFINERETGVSHDDLIRGLEARRIRINNRFFPCHLTSYMRPRGHRFGECPVTERIWFEEQVNLPLSPRHRPDQIDYAITQVTDLITQLRAAGAAARGTKRSQHNNCQVRPHRSRKAST